LLSFRNWVTVFGLNVSAQTRAEKPTVLLVEDMADDVVLIQRSFEETGLGNRLQAVGSAGEAKAYLRGESVYRERNQYPLPALILLDLKMPGEDGFDFLSWLRAQPEFKKIPVVVLTASDESKDMTKAYQLGANSFLMKPQDFENFVETSRLLQEYWLKLAHTPSAPRKKA
jgi:CheY-like chemotaxis protein